MVIKKNKETLTYNLFVSRLNKFANIKKFKKKKQIRSYNILLAVILNENVEFNKIFRVLAEIFNSLARENEKLKTNQTTTDITIYTLFHSLLHQRQDFTIEMKDRPS